MHGRKGIIIKWIITACAALAALAAIVSCKSQYLLLRNEHSGKVLFCTEAADGSGFSVSYVHSVNKSPVSEYYKLLSGNIYLTELRYSAFGAGMPTELADEQRLNYENGMMVISGFDRRMDYLCYNISRVAGHNLNLDELSIPLTSLDEPGQPVLFTAVELPRILAFLGIFPR